jgi:uncharacterized protein with GYD domain
MATYVMFGKYDADAVKGISAKRTDKAVALLKELGGEFQAGYALLGGHDLVLIVELPGPEEAMKASVGMLKLTGISFTTSPAVTIQAFDKLIERV